LQPSPRHFHHEPPLAVAIARYYFYSVTDAVAPLLNLTNSGSGSDVINKVAVAHLCKLLPNHFDDDFIPLSSIHYHSTRLATSNNLFLPRVNSSSGKCSLNLRSAECVCSYCGLRVCSQTNELKN